MNHFKLSNYTVFTDVIDSDLPEDQQTRIAYSTRSGISFLLREASYQAIRSGGYHGLPDSVIHKLLDYEILVPGAENEFDEILKRNVLAPMDSKLLGVTIQPSANCQLGCHYCGQVHTKHYMSKGYLDKVAERVTKKANSKDFNALSVTWYGGEPLMAPGQIRELTGTFKALCAEKNMAYSAGMITNGLGLKVDVFNELVSECDLNYFQITIDGSEKYHDTRRITKTGNSTFAIILKNLCDITSQPSFSPATCTINIRMNIDQTNYEGVAELMDILYDHGLHKKVIISFAPITDWGGNDAGKASLTKEGFAEMEIDWFMKAYRQGFHLDIIPGRNKQVCMVVNQDSEVYDAHGNIYPCWEFPYTPTYETGEYLIGNLAFDEATYNQNATTRNWNEDVKHNSSWCKNCTFFPVCGGSCPKSWYEGTPACPSFKFNMEDRLILRHIMNSTKAGEVLF